MSGPRARPDRDDSVLCSILNRRKGHVHLVGICGIGMAGLANLLRARGFRVSGCDPACNRMSGWLAKRGIRVQTGHDAGHLDAGVTWVVRSSAVSPRTGELRRARAHGIPVFRRGAVLAALLTGRDGVAVAGTHGKTTTATFLAQILMRAGRDPSWCIGGESDRLGGVSAAGKGRAMVVEADESDGTLGLYRPVRSVITNVEFDHAEHFADAPSLEACFRRLIRHTAGRVFYCADDERAAALGRDVAESVGYGFSARADVRAVRVRESAAATRFDIVWRGGTLRGLRLGVPGRQNVLNALAAAAVGLEMGLPAAEIRAALPGLSLPRRRFECVTRRGGIRVISDYAHHPTEIAALIRTARRARRAGRLLGVFQPHRYSRTRALGPDFPSAFAGLDRLVLVPVYAASEKPRPGGTVWDLYEHFAGRPAGGRAKPVVTVAVSLEQAWGYLRGERQRGDSLLVIGAGDVEKIAQWAAEQGRARRPRLPVRSGGTEVRFREPLAGRTTLRVGGAADLWAGAESAADLAALLKWAHAHTLPLHVLGAGSNALVSDLGVRGLTVQLTGREFRRVRVADDVVTAGGGLRLSALLARLESRGRTGLEFLEGIPGTVGGALQMNAGAWGEAICEQVVWIRCLNRDGSECIVNRKMLTPGYRRCGGLENRIVVEAGLRVRPGRPADLAARRAGYRARRSAMPRRRSAGSVFRNPEGKAAGRLIEAAGLKGAAVGGASVSARHANVILTAPGASASDVQALIEKVRRAVAEQYGVRLENEVRYFA